MKGEETKPDQVIPPSLESPPPAQISENPPASPPHRRRYLIPAIVILVLLGGIGWIIFNRLILPMLMGGGGAPPPTPVQLATPKNATVAESSDYAANLDSRQSVTLQPRVAGQISEIYVQPGDTVQAGEPLLQIDSEAQRAQVSSRVAAVDTAAADIAAAEAEVDNAAQTLASLEARRASAQADVQLNQKEYERFQELYRQGATPQQNVDQRLNTLRVSQAALQEAEANIQAQRSSINRTRANVTRSQRAYEQAQANVSEGEAQLQYYTITAPFTGIVGSIPVKVGDVVANNTQLLTVTQNNSLEVEIQVPLERSPALRVGLPVQLLDEQQKVLQSGRTSFVSPDVDPATQSILVKARFVNAGNLRTSQFVRARIIWSQSPGVLVPTTVISRLGGRNFVFVATPQSESECEAQPGAPALPPEQLVGVQKPVELGKIVGNDQEVIEGLTASDRIVSSGILQLQNCAAIADAAQMTKPQ
jgi:RND family efflux transporter MFP subunit